MGAKLERVTMKNDYAGALLAILTDHGVSHCVLASVATKVVRAENTWWVEATVDGKSFCVTKEFWGDHPLGQYENSFDALLKALLKKQGE